MAAEDVVISASVHCDGCARKLRRSLQRLDGVGEVSVDSRTNTVVVSGPGAVENAAEAVGIVERKTGKKATLLNHPSKGARQMKESDDTTGGGDTTAGHNDIAEVDTDMVIVLRINLHCDACCEEIKRRILKIQGVKEASPLLKSSQLVVKGTVEPATLVGFIHRSTGRKAAITRAEPLDHHHHLLPTTTMDEAAHNDETTKHQQDPSSVVNNNPEGKKDDAAGHKEMNDDDEAAPPREEEQQNDNNGSDEKLRRPSDGDRGGVDDGDAPTNNGFVVEKNHKKDDHLFRAPLLPTTTTRVVTAVAPEMNMAFNNFNPYYYSYPSYYYPYPHQHHQYYQPYPYAYSSSSSPAVYGNYPQGPPEAFSEENPNACTIV